MSVLPELDSSWEQDCNKDISEEDAEVALQLTYSRVYRCVEKSRGVLDTVGDPAPVRFQIKVIGHVSTEISKNVISIVRDCGPVWLQIEATSAEDSKGIFGITGDCAPVRMQVEVS
jgi:hypothetical protein